MSEPQRTWTLHNPLGVHVVEWGPADGPPLVLVHGGGDFVRAFDGFAPLLAEAGWRVIAWDQRGHGDSDRAELYGWSAELRDLVGVLRAVPGGPHPVIGHSKGGVIALDVAAARPSLVSAVVAIDGFIRRVFPPQPAPDTAPRWLDLQRSDRTARAEEAERLAEGRQALNPRLDRSWIDHLVAVGTRPAEPGGALRSWKIDPAAFPLPPHGVTTEACLERMAAIRCPLLALVAGVPESMAGQPTADQVGAYLPESGRLEVLDGLGHFAHIEAPRHVADRVLTFLAETVRSAPGPR
jgi:pimeloyl-ACP methyl ester carboxylesterase